MTLECTLNGAPLQLELEDPATPLLWVLRDALGLMGTKFGCGRAACGACTVLIDGEAVRCCSYPAANVVGKTITTIEGLGSPDAPHPVQQAWMEEIVPQCGYCQPGFIMAAAALLEKIPQPTDTDIDQHIVNVCRCGTHGRIRKAIHRAAALLAVPSTENPR
ncbi:(2Fe-2S)-binding protein [Robiginitalea sediminis]|uniref:(2Fe-2S)-binding protein n=1 Tax=Robiginitalea sediminis TaxID=1982593 RepID=UPI000B4B63F6|nr:(2Fe-2S)-binding protein [Robiginitalea sediminis]